MTFSKKEEKGKISEMKRESWFELVVLTRWRDRKGENEKEKEGNKTDEWKQSKCYSWKKKM